MVSSLGFDVATSCAAARAGLSRAASIDHYVIVSEEGEDIGVTCHATALGTSGFEGQVRLMRLADLALTDLYHSNPWLINCGRCAAYVATTAREGDLSEEHDSEHKEKWTDWLPHFPRRRADSNGRVKGQSSLAVRFSIEVGATGFAHAVAAAKADLSSGIVDSAFVGGVDCLLDEETLARLEADNRLKSPDAPAGLQPGEGAAFIVLQLAHNVPANQSLAILGGIGWGVEENPAGGEETPTGAGLANAIHAALTASGEQGRFWCIADQNGEHYRAMEWGCADVLLAASSLGHNMHPSRWNPAVSFGDTGAAAAPIAVCMAITAAQRGYAPAKTAIITIGADQSGERAALALLRA
jgi:3-oxoacyl-[acyl-carrier-protein] synthase-1